ncbi:LamG-like jellyroll fold domain-containing protein [Spirosoma litoris]
MKTVLEFLKYASVIALVLLLDGCSGGDKTPAPQTGFNITVTDKLTNQKIPNASLSWEYRDAILQSENGTGATNSNGFFEEKSETRKPGHYRITVTVVGYKITSQDFTVSAGNISSLPVKLELESPLEITPSNVTFNNNESAKSVYFKNKSTQYDLVLSIEPAQKDDWVKFSQTSLTIPPGSQKEVTVTVNRTGRGFDSYNSTAIVNFKQNGIPFTDNLNVYMIIANPQAPTVTTNQPTGITQNSADVLGTLTSVGGSPVTDRGIYYSEATDPKPDNASKASVGGGNLGAFTATARSLKAGTHYYVRAYATNANGTGLGEVKEFTTSVDPTPPALAIDPIPDNNITLNTASVTAMITSNGGSTVSRQGFCISTTSNPTLADKVFEANADGSGKFGVNLTGLSQGVVYYVRAFAINSLGDTKPGYSSTITFKTQVPVTAAEVSTLAATNVAENSASLQGNLTVLGSSPVVQHGFCWSTTNAEPTIADKSKTVEKGSLASTGRFDHPLTGLNKGTNYYLRAYVTTQDGKTYYGSTKEIVTTESGLQLYYPFNGNSIDMSGNGNNANAEAKLTTDRDGNQGRAYDLSAGPIIVQNKNYLGGYTGDMSIAFWAKMNPSNFSGDPKYLLSKFIGCGIGDGYYLFTDPATNTLSFYVGYYEKQNTFPLIKQAELTDKWHHIVFTKSGKTLNFYLDGDRYISVKSDFDQTRASSWPYDYSLDGTTLNVGNLRTCNKNTNFNALFDEFRVYNFQMTDGQVSELWKR